MAPRFFLRLLGEPELQSPDGERVRLRVRKHLALLAYFAAHRGQVHRRDRLADFLWPEASPAEGRHSVAVALSAIRGKLGLRTFECSRDTVRFLAPNLDVDLDRLARGDVLDTDLTPALRVDAFLGDFEVGRAPEFMLWRDQMQARWLPQIQNALVALMDRCRRTGDFSGIEAHADRLLALDEYSEQAVRAKMEARAFTGDRVAAIRIYEEWRSRLAADLDTAPSALLEGLALRLRQRGFEAPGSIRMPTVLTEQWRHQAFIGRGAQYRSLYENWEHTKGGAGRHGLVLGESGVGKSTLAQRVITAAGLEGAISSRVQCYEVEREIPYAAVGTLVRGLLDQPGASGTPPEWLGELARTVSAVRERFPGLPPFSSADGETIRIRLTEAMLQLALAVAEEHPVILVVDDVHIADDASVAVLHLLMRRTRGQRIMVLMTARREELDRSPHASRLLESREHLGLQVLDLPPFTNDEMQELVTALGHADGRPVPLPLRRALIHAAAGIPMVAELLHDDWRRRGTDCLALSLGAMTSELAGSSTEEVYRRLFHRVFDSLSSEAQAVLNLAAILGERLNDHQLYELVDLTIGQCLTGTLELARRRLFVDDGHKLQFRNELIRGYAYLAVPSPLRRALHGLVADRLLQAAARGEAIPGLTLAWHCFRGGRAVEAVPHLLAGAREAIDHGAPHEAELGLSSAIASLPIEARAEAALLLAESLQEQGRWEESIAILEPGDHGSESWGLRREVLCLYAHATLPHSETEARETLSRLQALTTGGVPESARSLALEGLERAATYLNDTEAASHSMKWALEILASTDGLSHRVRLAISLVVLAWITRSTTCWPDVLQTLRELTEEATAGGLACTALGRLHSAQGSIRASAGDYEGAVEHYSAARAIYIRLCNPLVQALTEANLSLCYGRIGNYVEQLAWAERAMDNLPAALDSWTRIKIAYRAAWALGMLGEVDRALQLIHNAGEHRERESRAWARQAEGVSRADILTILGRNKLALDVAAETIAEFGKKPISHAYAGPVARWVAKLGWNNGELGESIESLDHCWEGLLAYDVIDQAEIASAKVWLEKSRGREWPDGESKLQSLLNELPSAVRSQLSRLGFPA